MPSQTDIDQGNTSRQWVQAYMGPTLGSVWVPSRSLLAIIAAGSYSIDLSTTLVQVNVAGSVTITLPSVANATFGGAQGAQPGRFVKATISVVDVGGFAQANPITIQPFGSETIDGLSSITLNSNFGVYRLTPSNGTWSFA